MRRASRFDWTTFGLFLRDTWAGRILAINAIVFAVSSVMSGSILSTSPEVSWLLGAQDPVAIAQGQVFRFFTPMFLHGGLIHFLFNSLAILVVGRDLEPIFGRARFLCLYLCSGVISIIASANLGLHQSVGASGAIFGLLGAGLLLEKSISRQIEEQTGKKPGRGPYISMLIINLPISLLPMIDGYAHLAGCIAGIAIAFALFKWFPNRLMKLNRPLAIALSLALAAISTVGIVLSTNPERVFERYREEADEAQRPEQKVHYLSGALALKPEARLIFERGKALYVLREDAMAQADFQAAIAEEPGLASELEVFLDSKPKRVGDKEDKALEN